MRRRISGIEALITRTRFRGKLYNGQSEVQGRDLYDKYSTYFNVTFYDGLNNYLYYFGGFLF